MPNTLPDLADRYERLLCECVQLLEAGASLAEIDNKLRALRLTHAALPETEKSNESVRFRQIEEAVANLRREMAAAHRGGRLHHQPLSTRPRTPRCFR
ncbi:MAG: hypothetical protein AAF805_00140 [Planctomycetota bacterium]